MSNHILIRLIRFVSRFTVHLCNAIYFLTTFTTLYKWFTKILYFRFWNLSRPWRDLEYNHIRQGMPYYCHELPLPFSQCKPSSKKPNTSYARVAQHRHCEMKKVTASKKGQPCAVVWPVFLPCVWETDAFIVLDLRAVLGVHHPSSIIMNSWGRGG